MTKSVLATLIGSEVLHGRIHLDDPAPVPGWSSDPELSLITWKDLLRMNSGLQWKEVYSWRSPATRMLYMEGDMFDFLRDRKAEFPRGTHWQYSSGTSNLISGLLRQVTGDDDIYHLLPFTAMAIPVGMNSFVMETDDSGTFVGSSYGHATARDWGRFGQLYLQNGIVNGQRLFPEDWVSFVTTPSTGADGKYGAHFWLNRDKHLPDVPEDMYYADGFMGQRVFIFPSNDLVVVRLGLSLHEQPDYNGMLKDILEEIREAEVKN
jgi:CubicO group peptidase (beta-lactamase class C family)